MTEPEPKPDPTRRWSPDEFAQAIAREPVVFDHPLYRKAPAVSVAVGVAAGLAVFLFAETPWWMPILVFLIVAAVLFRFLRPRLRHPSIEDEI